MGPGLLSALIAALVLAVAGCGRDVATPPPAQAAPHVGRLRFLALGDSYTIGESVAPGQRWPVLLAASLRKAGLDLSDPQIVAATGWTTAELARGLDHAAPQGPFDLVSLLIGVNNQFRGRGEDEYRREFAALLQRAVAFARGEPRRVLVLSIPDWGVTPAARSMGRDAARVGAEIDRFNAINRDEARRAGARYVDVTPVSREATADPALTAPDALHPSGAMYERWAELALPEARAALSAP